MRGDLGPGRRPMGLTEVRNELGAELAALLHDGGDGLHGVGPEGETDVLIATLNSRDNASLRARDCWASLGIPR